VAFVMIFVVFVVYLSFRCLKYSPSIHDPSITAMTSSRATMSGRPAT